jgi:energy-coupling factor transport system ATP-binding protein
MIELQNVTYTYPGAPRPALRGVSVRVPEGSFTLVVGSSGAGKSTLLRSVNGLVPHFTGGVLSGVIRVAGLDPVAVSPAVMSRHVGCVFQDPEAQAVLDRVEDDIAFALEHAGLARQEMRVRVEEVLDLLDLAALRSRPLETLSGGERQRVAIAAALALRPRILVLDEPTSQLDPQSAEDVLQALVRLNHDLGLTVLLAEHRLERVLPFADQLVSLGEAGEGALSGPPADTVAQVPLAPPLVELGRRLGWSPLPLTIRAGLRFSREMELPEALPPPQNGGASAGPAYLQLQGVEVAYNGMPALGGVDVAVQPGEVVVLLGRNGAGKTTLLKCAVGLVRPRRGRVLVAGEDIAGQDVAAICRKVAYLPQDPNALLFADTVRDEVLITLRNHGLAVNPTESNRPPPASTNREPAEDSSSFAPHPSSLLDRLGLAAKAGAYPRDLSAGERQRVALAAILAPAPRALLLDEPTRGLDYIAKRALAGLLRKWRAAGAAILIVTHDVEFAATLADRVVLLSQGRVLAAGTPAAVLGTSPLFAPQVARLFPGTGWLTVEDALRGLGKEP